MKTFIYSNIAREDDRVRVDDDLIDDWLSSNGISLDEEDINLEIRNISCAYLTIRFRQRRAFNAIRIENIRCSETFSCRNAFSTPDLEITNVETDDICLREMVDNRYLKNGRVSLTKIKSNYADLYRVVNDVSVTELYIRDCSFGEVNRELFIRASDVQTIRIDKETLGQLHINDRKDLVNCLFTDYELRDLDTVYYYL